MGERCMKKKREGGVVLLSFQYLESKYQKRRSSLGDTETFI
jgi:hypothetical protein